MIHESNPALPGPASPKPGEEEERDSGPAPFDQIRAKATPARQRYYYYIIIPLPLPLPLPYPPGRGGVGLLPDSLTETMGRGCRPGRVGVAMYVRVYLPRGSRPMARKIRTRGRGGGRTRTRRAERDNIGSGGSVAKGLLGGFFSLGLRFRRWKEKTLFWSSHANGRYNGPNPGI